MIECLYKKNRRNCFRLDVLAALKKSVIYLISYMKKTAEINLENDLKVQNSVCFLQKPTFFLDIKIDYFYNNINSIVGHNFR